MPIQRGFDSEGCYYQYGDTGAKYHYKCGNEEARQRAYDKARAQEIAIGEFSAINFKSYTDYPQAATENAKIALRWVEENGWGDCGTAVGKARANQLANREPISRDTIARMAAFERHRQNSDKELGDGCGRLMWLAWGGDEGIAWAQRKLEQIDKGTDLIKYTTLKKWRNTAVSSNVDKIMYNDETNELVIKFNSGDYYTYYDIDFQEFINVIDGNAVCRTSGESRWGSWDVGKTPSVGAAVYRYLVNRGVRYTKGGSLK